MYVLILCVSTTALHLIQHLLLRLPTAAETEIPSYTVLVVLRLPLAQYNKRMNLRLASFHQAWPTFL
jgi:hypothetical protein